MRLEKIEFSTTLWQSIVLPLYYRRMKMVQQEVVETSYLVWKTSALPLSYCCIFRRRIAKARISSREIAGVLTIKLHRKWWSRGESNPYFRRAKAAHLRCVTTPYYALQFLLTRLKMPVYETIRA